MLHAVKSQIFPSILLVLYCPYAWMYPVYLYCQVIFVICLLNCYLILPRGFYWHTYLQSSGTNRHPPQRKQEIKAKMSRWFSPFFTMGKVWLLQEVNSGFSFPICFPCISHVTEQTPSHHCVLKTKRYPCWISTQELDANLHSQNTVSLSQWDSKSYSLSYCL